MAKKEQKSVQLKKIYSVDHSGGVQARTLPALSNNNQLLHCLNGVFGQKIGAVVGRNGTVEVQECANTVNNMFVQRNSDENIYFVVQDTGTYNNILYNTTGFDGSLTSGLASHFSNGGTVNMVSFAGKTFFFNGITAPRSYDGSTFSAITNAPTTGKFATVFNQALWVLTPDGWLWYSDVINADGTDFSSTTWESIGINPVDGQSCKALKRHRGYLVIFKDDSIYRYNGNTADPEAIINIGTPSERGVVQTDTHMYFFNPRGIYRMALGDPLNISRGVQKYINGMPSANWSKVAAGKDANSNLYFYLGTVTINDPMEWDYGHTYTDLCLVWDYELERWSVFTNVPADLWFYDIDDGTQYFADGDTIKKFDAVFSDCGDPIDFQAMWQPIDYSIPQAIKTVDHIFMKTTPNVQIVAGNSVDNMAHSGIYREETKTNHIKDKIAFSELWIQAHESYDELPPCLEMLCIGDAYARNIV